MHALRYACKQRRGTGVLALALPLAMTLLRAGSNREGQGAIYWHATGGLFVWVWMEYRYLHNSRL